MLRRGDPLWLYIYYLTSGLLHYSRLCLFVCSVMTMSLLLEVEGPFLSLTQIVFPTDLTQNFLLSPKRDTRTVISS